MQRCRFIHVMVGYRLVRAGDRYRQCTVVLKGRARVSNVWLFKNGPLKRVNIQRGRLCRCNWPAVPHRGAAASFNKALRHSGVGHPLGLVNKRSQHLTVLLKHGLGRARRQRVFHAVPVEN